MINHNYIISMERFEIMCRIYKLDLSYVDMSRIYNIFKDIFKYDTCFTFLDEDTELIKYTLNCKYVIEQICYELGIKL